MPPKGSIKAAAPKRKLDEATEQPEAKRLQQHPITAANPVVAADLLKLYAAYNSILKAATHGDAASEGDYLILLEAAQGTSLPPKTVAARLLPKFAPLFPDLLDCATEAIIQLGSLSLHQHGTNNNNTSDDSSAVYNTISGLNYLLDTSQETGNTNVVLSLVTFTMRALSSFRNNNSNNTADAAASQEEAMCWRLLTKAFICFPQIVLAGAMHALQDSSIPQCEVCCRLLTHHLLKPLDVLGSLSSSNGSGEVTHDDDDDDNTLMMLALKYKAIQLDPKTRQPSSSKNSNGIHPPPLPTIAGMVFTTLPLPEQQWVHDQCTTTLKMGSLGLNERQLVECLLEQVPRLTTSPSPPPPTTAATTTTTTNAYLGGGGDTDNALRPSTGAVAMGNSGGRGAKRRSSSSRDSPQLGEVPRDSITLHKLGNGAMPPPGDSRRRSSSFSRQSTPSSIEAGEIPVGPPPSKKPTQPMVPSHHHQKKSRGRSPLGTSDGIITTTAGHTQQQQQQQPPASSSLLPVTDELPHAVSSDKPTPAAACLVIRGLPTTTAELDAYVKTMCEREAGRGAVALVYSPSSKKGSTYVLCHSMKDAVKIVERLDGSTPSNSGSVDGTTRPIDVRLCQTTLKPPPSSSGPAYNIVSRCYYLWVPASLLEHQQIREVSSIGKYLARVSTSLPDPTEPILEVYTPSNGGGGGDTGRSRDGGRSRSRSLSLSLLQGAVVPFASLSAAHETLHTLKDRAMKPALSPYSGNNDDHTNSIRSHHHHQQQQQQQQYDKYEKRQYDHPSSKPPPPPPPSGGGVSYRGAPPPPHSSSSSAAAAVPPHKVLWIGGITSPRAMDYILDMADDYGRVTTHRHMRGCAFIEYSSIEEATAARRGMNGTKMSPGVYLKVEYKRELDTTTTNNNRGGGGGGGGSGSQHLHHQPLPRRRDYDEDNNDDDHYYNSYRDREGGGGGGRRGMGMRDSRSPPTGGGGGRGGGDRPSGGTASLLTGGPSGREGSLSWSGELCKGVKSGTNTVCYVSCYDGTAEMARGPMVSGGGGGGGSISWIDMEPKKWPETLEVTNRVPIKGVCQDLFGSLLPNERALLRLLPRDVERDGPGLVSFCAYLESKDRAGVVELPPVVPVGERTLLLIPPSEEVCRRLGVSWPPVSSGMSRGCMLGLIVPSSSMR
jgi:hypothetical protein